MTWTKSTLGQLADDFDGAIQTGPFGAQLHRSDYQEYGTPAIMPQDIVGDRVTTDSIARVDDSMVRKLSRHVLQVGDIVYPRRGDLNKRALIGERETGWLCGTGCIKISLSNSPVIPNFLFYYLKQSQIVQWIENKAVGATMLNLSGTVLKTVPIEYPDRKTQKRIAEILSNYDRLIDNNNRRIALLEESVHLLYKEWFVKLRFPGWEKTAIVDGIPEGWRKAKLVDLCELINYGYTASATQDKTGVKFLRITDIVPPVLDWSTVPYCDIPEDQKYKYFLKEGDVVVARTGATVGYAKRIHKRHPESIFASYLVRLRFNDEIDNTIAGTFLESDYFKSYIRANVGGAAQPNANAKIISGAQILVPSRQIQKHFKEIVELSLDQKELLQIQNQKLREARDRLLPRLMNGSIVV